MLEKANLDEDYQTFKKLIDVYPQYFPVDQFTYEVYKWALSFVSQRCFGFGLGTTALIPLADMINYSLPEKTTFSFFQKDLHLDEDNAYLYEKNYDKMFGVQDPKLSLEEKIYVLDSSKA